MTTTASGRASAPPGASPGGVQPSDTEKGGSGFERGHNTHPGVLPDGCRAEYPNSSLVPPYTPVFSDGWLPPETEQERQGGPQDTPEPASVPPFHFRRPSVSLPPAQPPATGWRDNPSQG